MTIRTTTPSELTGIPRIKQWRDKAEELRVCAELCGHQCSKFILIDLAKTYDQPAEHEEQRDVDNLRRMGRV